MTLYRTGVMICCCKLSSLEFSLLFTDLVFSQFSKTAVESLQYYGEKRTKDSQGVTIPSQRRYCYYFEQYLRNQYPIRGSVKLVRVNVRQFNKSTKYFISIKNLKKEEIFNSKQQNKVVATDDSVTFDLEDPVTMNGDFKICCIKNGVNILKASQLFHCWMNSRFITNAVKNTSPGNGMGVNTYHDNLNEKIPLVKSISLGLRSKSEKELLPQTDARLQNGKYVTVSLCKDELDGPHSDKHHKKYSEDFQIDFTFQLENMDKVEDDSYLLGMIPKEFLREENKRHSQNTTKRDSIVTRGLIIDSHQDDDLVEIIDQTSTPEVTTSSNNTLFH